MKITRAWGMPSGNTFDIEPIRKFIIRHYDPNAKSIDPFSNKNKLASITNDLDPDVGADYCMDALDFLKMFKRNEIDLVFFDPPYSPRQVSEIYKKLGKSVNMETTQSSFWSKMKSEIERILKPSGICLSFGWNSQGVGIKRGFVKKEILLVAHGGNHNDTICMAEYKDLTLF